MQEKNFKLIWDEIEFSDQAISLVTPDTEPPFEKKSLKTKSDILELKSHWKNNKQLKIEFLPENYLHTNLKGEILFKQMNQHSSFYLLTTENNHKDTMIRLERIKTFYETDFLDDPEILEILSSYLIEENRIAELVSICNKFQKKASLPLKYQFFLILCNIYPNNLGDIILSGEEKIIINILYKYKFLELTKTEKSILYDLVLTSKNSNLIGLIYHLYKNEFKGIRNISPILQIILSKFNDLSLDEKKDFLETYSKTNQFFKIYFLMKTCYEKAEIKQFFKNINKIYGKDKEFNLSIENKLKDIPDKNKLVIKYNFLKELDNLTLLSPFEIILLLNSTSSLELTEKIKSYYDKYPESYSANKAISVIYFHEEDFKKFLMQISKSGNFKFQMEILYLKAIAYREIGLKEESERIFLALRERYPHSDILAKEAGI